MKLCIKIPSYLLYLLKSKRKYFLLLKMAIQYVGTLVSTRIGRFRTTRQKYELFCPVRSYTTYDIGRIQPNR